MWLANNNCTFSSHQKLQIQEKAAQEVKLAIKPFYQNKDITKEEYKEIVRKAVDKVSYSFIGVLYILFWPTSILIKEYLNLIDKS
jgi:hypothetical protein